MGKHSIKILVNFTNYLYYEAIKSLLANEQATSESQQYIVECMPPDEEFVPDIILVDFYNLDQKLFSRYSDAKVFLIDTGLELEVIASILFSNNIAGLLSYDTDVHLLKKAFKAVSSGKIWLTNKHVKTLLHKAGFSPRRGSSYARG
jgi:hypothetical protein